ncbi:ABC-2 type transport system ATP-binding protein [Hydrogenispora ethanolica]|uniref:ABC-2 type transport system ATP-binding protein n=1 Tax=Hydrogenispora ethanolica TaxID=1082276 RepID=A0A4R1R2Y6_HYDET|nr:ABC transporter ATP-binding protein [Hydrogenispora ethanolica]TCL59751.1 ABC-2 type transport system ATP-binding protein [Hydrogenispora ethanolica]
MAGNVRKTKGRVSLGGFDLDRDELATKRVIGVVPQEIAFDFVFTVAEVLKLQSGYFGLRNNRDWIDRLLAELALEDKRNSRVRDLSGGMKRRLLIAKALVHRPQLLILDEPTAGVDIQLRRSLHDFLLRLHRTGTTIILTTHYLEEAEKLCNRVVIIDQGRIVADEPRQELMARFAGKINVRLRLEETPDGPGWEDLQQFRPEREEPALIRLQVKKEGLADLFQTLSRHRLSFTDLNIDQPKLEEVYLKLINHGKERPDETVTIV